MNFYEEIEREFKNVGINGRIVPVPEELKPTTNDFNELDNIIEIKCEENRNMMFLCKIYAENSMPCGYIESKNQIKVKKLINNNRR